MRNAIVIGAGPAGLACAAMLREAGATPEILEKADTVASSWRAHYDGLKLHTVKGRSALPGLAMPASYPRFPARSDVIAYLESYAAHFGLTPRLGCPAKAVRRVGDEWEVSHPEGVSRAPVVVMATGLNSQPRLPVWPGQDGFAGRILHASAYRNAAAFAGQRVLIVGLGNSGGDIAVELAEAGLTPDLSVRGPVNILPISLLGVPITSMGLLRKLFGYRAADALAAPALRAAIGRPSDYGLAEPGKGPMAQVVEDGRVPLIDHGALAAIKAGRVRIRPAIARFDGAEIVFTDEGRAPYDTVILATGYQPDLRPLLGTGSALLDPDGRPPQSGGESGASGLFFCSYHASAEGQLRQIGQEAREIAAAAQPYLSALAHPS